MSFRSLKNLRQYLCVSIVLMLLPGLIRGQSLFAATAGYSAVPVTLVDNGAAFILSNGDVTASIDKSSASLLSLKFKGIDLLGIGNRSNGYWSMPGTHYRFGPNPIVKVIDNPATNGGKRATISIEFRYDGNSKTVPANVDIHYSLAQGQRSIYLEAIWQHKPDFPALSFPVGRFAVKLNDSVFDWMTVDARRNMKMITAYDWDHGTPLNLKEARRMNTGIMKGQVEHKYDYSAVQFDTPAYGWSSTKQHVGLWMVTPSYEYMSGGPTKLELTTHRDATFSDSLTAPAAPTILNVWKGPHYGGTSLFVSKGEEWTKTVGPFLLYCNSAPTHDAMWKDALAKAASESRQWPYSWATSLDYPNAAERGNLKGQIVLRDLGYPHTRMTHLLVGLTHPDYSLPNGEKINWQKDGKYYQYWTRGDTKGTFSIANVRPGTYTLHAIADGVLGEYVQTNVTISAGKPLDIGKLIWKPLRYGRQLWQIGIPDRTSGEFLHGNHYWQWGIYNEYPKDFPHDVHYVIGKSDFHKDWNMMQVPHALDTTGKSRGTATTWSVIFNLSRSEQGQAILRLALAGTEAQSLAIAVNNHPVATLSHLPNTSAIHRDADRSYWQEKDISFDASLLKVGKNVLTLTVPAGPVMSGIEYDYLRLELNDHPSISAN